jgi:hypothetical protein
VQLGCWCSSPWSCNSGNIRTVINAKFEYLDGTKTDPYVALLSSLYIYCLLIAGQDGTMDRAHARNILFRFRHLGTGWAVSLAVWEMHA